MTEETFEIYFKAATVIVPSIITSLIAYHKYLMRLLEKKMDKDDCGRQQEILAEKRNNLEILFEERTKTQFKQLNEIRDDLKIIKEYIAKN